MSRLRPHPHRGEVIAAGAVPLAVAAFVIDLRMTQWSVGTRFVVVALIAALLLTMGWLAELEEDAPRAYHSILLIAALAGIVAVEAFVSWAFRPHGAGTFRAILLVLTLAFVLGAVRLRDRRRRHAVQRVNAAGVSAAVLAGTYLVAGFLTALIAAATNGSSPLGPVAAPFGWELYLLAVGLGLVAYSGVDHEPGPAYIGVAVLLAFAVLTGGFAVNRGSLVGWPLFLLVIGAVGLAIGLRPRQALPPPPSTPAPPMPPPTVPLRPVDDGA